MGWLGLKFFIFKNKAEFTKVGFEPATSGLDKLGLVAVCKSADFSTKSAPWRIILGWLGLIINIPTLETSYTKMYLRQQRVVDNTSDIHTQSRLFMV